MKEYRCTFNFCDWKEFEKYLDSLENDDAASLLAKISKIEEYGIIISLKEKWIKRIAGFDGLYEIRSRHGNNIQRVIYFSIGNNDYMVTHGFTKKSQKVPLKEIKKAQLRKQKYFESI
ncbi:type II toxin-antitoxin system RelE/ParE family toxin [Companilactobacillus suantsaicola]|uniref:Type II toxin-antitoxin system RelE/ParE family toxin n=1 Tax=Companilactobacillus suantsaicola TaxID=2487723 RepID=A0A4Z0JIH3_9LACO|nr:type II toxin-antitoxin system RelE/ParE family toxin [Companilactobacillus suantsaicola]TGD22830.1 type II toxin-antitoxin system RelE/ParE family toxin [Companilactobacillus suantsaicola]